MKPRWEGIVGWLLVLTGAYFVVWSVVALDNLGPAAGALLVLAGTGHITGRLHLDDEGGEQ